MQGLALQAREPCYPFEPISSRKTAFPICGRPMVAPTSQNVIPNEKSLKRSRLTEPTPDYSGKIIIFLFLHTKYGEAREPCASREFQDTRRR